jgi:hypothetical protein
MTTLTSPRPHHENELAPERGPTVDKNGIASYYNYSSEADVRDAGHRSEGNSKIPVGLPAQEN